MACCCHGARPDERTVSARRFGAASCLPASLTSPAGRRSPASSAVAEGDGPAATALDPGQGRSLRAAVAADTEARGAGNSPLWGARPPAHAGAGRRHGASGIQGRASQRRAPAHRPSSTRGRRRFCKRSTRSALTARQSGGRRRLLSAIPACRRSNSPRSRPRAPSTVPRCQSRTWTTARGPRSAGGRTTCRSAGSAARPTARRCCTWNGTRRGGWRTGSPSTTISVTR